MTVDQGVREETCKWGSEVEEKLMVSKQVYGTGSCGAHRQIGDKCTPTIAKCNSEGCDWLAVEWQQ